MGPSARIALVVLGLVADSEARAQAPDSGRILALTNGFWFDGRRFAPKTVYIVEGLFRARAPAGIDSTIDLAGGYVIPPFGEAHNHNALPDTAIIRRYLREGIFYVKNPNNRPRDRVAAVGVLNAPRAIDVSFSDGGLTAPGGHPFAIAARNISRGSWSAADGEGGFYWSIGSRADLDRKWDAIIRGRPDFLKTYLLYSEEYERRATDSAFTDWRGLEPSLYREIVRRARGAGLPVTTHVETAADFRLAVGAGANEINHLPGFRPDRGQIVNYAPNLRRYRLTAEDASAAYRAGVTVVPTIGETLRRLDATEKAGGPQAAEASAVRQALLDNLRLLKDAGVAIAIGSDDYRGTSTGEAHALAATGIWSNQELLSMWTETTARAIFPARRIGRLEEGYEASLLVLEGNPLDDLAALGRVRLRIKQGAVLEP